MNELGVHPAAGNVILCMGVCIMEEREEVLRCIASSDEARVELLRFHSRFSQVCAESVEPKDAASN